MNYLFTILVAIITFVSIAFVLSIPYMLYQYFKYGSIEVVKTLIFASFIFYFICAYYLVILPLPSAQSLAKIKGPYVQLQLFNFINDFFKHTVLNISNIKTYLPALKQNVVLQPLFNILLTVPLGIYIRFYKGDKKLLFVLIVSFLLSLFYELTQLSGLYFIYPHPYRLFDVDDLMLNTIGGILGYAIAPLILQFLPSLKELKEKAYEKSKKVSMLRRLFAFFLDCIFSNIIYMFISLFIHNKFNIYLSILFFLLYLIITPLIFNSSTLGMKIVHLKLTSDNNLDFIKIVKRVVMMLFIILVIPRISTLFFVSDNSNSFVLYFFFLAKAFYFLVLFIYYIYILISKEKLFYEKYSDTYIVSTLKK